MAITIAGDVVGPPIGERLCDKDAAYIVRACNSFPDGLALADLIVALTGNVDHSQGGGENTARLYGGMLNDIRDAAERFLAKARGQ